jgi:hypothetical protein
VTWSGPVPTTASYRAPVSPSGELAGGARRFWPSPNAPVIAPSTGGVANAVVFLRGVDPRRSRPWDHPPVRVEFREYQLYVCQGSTDARTGFVRRGDTIEMTSTQALFHSLQVRGAAFFALTFPEPGLVCHRRLERAGVVELQSGVGCFWMRGHLFVDDHPYYARTDAQGRFRLPQVPPGEYDLVCWLPNWHEAERELDADTGLICRLAFQPPFEVVQHIHLADRQTQSVPFRLNMR